MEEQRGKMECFERGDVGGGIYRGWLIGMKSNIIYNVILSGIWKILVLIDICKGTKKLKINCYWMIETTNKLNDNLVLNENESYTLKLV